MPEREKPDGEKAPFELQPPPPEPARPEAAREPEAAAVPAPAALDGAGPAPAASETPPLPQPAPAVPALGGRRSFTAILGVAALAGAGWPWKDAVREDWAAGAILLAALPALLSFAPAGPLPRLLGALAVPAAALCGARYLGALPGLGALSAAGVAFFAAAGGAWLALWDGGRDDRRLGRALCLLAGALAGFVVLGSPRDARVAWDAWALSGGGWRWGGLFAAGAAFFASARLKTCAPKAGKPASPVNWNR